jgi:tagatose-1,6-bisphosphate aldolase non-catalytic subunit AgaZ/GatZ
VRAHAQASKPGGVTGGVHTYSFRDRSLDAAIAALVELGVEEFDLGGTHLEPRRTRPPQASYCELVREWRLKVPIEDYVTVGRKLRNAGIRIAKWPRPWARLPWPCPRWSV